MFLLSLKRLLFKSLLFPVYMVRPQHSFSLERLERTPFEELSTLVAQYFADAPDRTASLRDVEHYLYGPRGIRQEKKDIERFDFLKIITTLIHEGVLHPS
jgi:hypothetical protein